MTSRRQERLLLGMKQIAEHLDREGLTSSAEMVRESAEELRQMVGLRSRYRRAMNEALDAKQNATHRDNAEEQMATILAEALRVRGDDG